MQNRENDGRDEPSMLVAIVARDDTSTATTLFIWDNISMKK